MYRVFSRIAEVLSQHVLCDHSHGRQDRDSNPGKRPSERNALPTPIESYSTGFRVYGLGFSELSECYDTMIPRTL